jgi:hypothetical protein
MAQQKSEDRVVPKGRRKSTPTREIEQPGGGRAVPVKGEGQQLMLPFATAENPQQQSGARRTRVPDRSGLRVQMAPKAKGKVGRAGPARMEEVVERLEEAFAKVAANQGAPGPDHTTIQAVAARLPDVMRVLRASLLGGTYQPGEIRRVWIPKPGG